MLKRAVALALGRARASRTAMHPTHALSPYGWTAARLPRPVAGLAERRIRQQRRLAVHGVGIRFRCPPGGRDSAHVGGDPFVGTSANTSIATASQLGTRTQVGKILPIY